MNRIIIIIAIIMWMSTEALSQGWTGTNNPQGGGVTDMAVLNDGTLLVTTGSFNWPGGQQGGIRRSTNGGNSWENVINAYNGRCLYAGPSGKVFASIWMYPDNEGMFVSTNGGVNWTQQFFGAANDNIFCIAAKNYDSMVFVGTRDGVYRNFNGGSWVQRTTGLPSNSWVRDIVINETGTIVIATTNGVFKSTNHGNNWEAAGSGIAAGDTVISLTRITSDGKLFCATSSGHAYKTNVSSFVWSNIYSYRNEVIGEIEITPDLADHFMIMIGNLAVDAFFDVLYSEDEGLNWEESTFSAPDYYPVSAIAFYKTGTNDIKVYAATYMNSSSGARIFYSDLKTVGVNQLSSEVPASFDLKQNYPNPFNPNTKIEFELSGSSNVKVVIYDVLGNEVMTAVDEYLTPGKFSIDVNMNNFSSGIYFYRMTAGDFTEVRKMNLLK